MAIARPEPDEYAPFFANYVALAGPDDVLVQLEDQIAERRDLLAGLSDEEGRHAYADGKWTLTEVIGHLLDTERLFSFRALWAVRGDPSPLPGMDQDHWMAQAHFGERGLAELLDELDHVRRSNLSFYSSLPATTLQRRARIEGREMSARATAWIIAGHERHHMGVLRGKYLQLD